MSKFDDALDDLPQKVRTQVLAALGNKPTADPNAVADEPYYETARLRELLEYKPPPLTPPTPIGELIELEQPEPLEPPKPLELLPVPDHKTPAPPHIRQPPSRQPQRHGLHSTAWYVVTALWALVLLPLVAAGAPWYLWLGTLVVIAAVLYSDCRV